MPPSQHVSLGPLNPLVGTESSVSAGGALAAAHAIQQRYPIHQALDFLSTWQAHWSDYTPDETLAVSAERLKDAFGQLTERLQGHYPFFHPLYAGQMVKPPHPVAVLGYLTTMLLNPNNHALEGGPATVPLEHECVGALARQFGYSEHLGHLTSGGTLANLEALWVAKQLHPDKPIAFSAQAHYTHKRMCQLMGASFVELPTTPRGQLDVSALKALLSEQSIGTLVVTLGSTSLGALDPLDELVELKNQYGFRIHVDMAYGGFYHVLKDDKTFGETFKPYRFVNQTDSLVIDPHKHGLQPYGCGCVLFQASPKTSAIRDIYRHESPYTYFESDELHPGEISLECSRPGAAAAAFWLTLQCFPLSSEEGFGAILRKTRQAALSLAAFLHETPAYCLYTQPDLDIVTYFPVRDAAGQPLHTTAEISARSHAIYTAGMQLAEGRAPLYLVKLQVLAEAFEALHPQVQVNTPQVTILRSCLLKPEHLDWLPAITEALTRLAQQAL